MKFWKVKGFFHSNNQLKFVTIGIMNKPHKKVKAQLRYSDTVL